MHSNYLFATQLNYTEAEQKIRKSPEYDELKQILKSVQQVQEWKDNKLEICLFSERGGKGKRQIKEPICFDNCTHIILDLYDILFKNDLQECNKCKKKPTKQNIKKEVFYKTIVSQLNEKAFFCSFYGNHVFHSYSQKVQPQANQLLQQTNEKLLEQIIKQTNQFEIEKNISSLIGRRVRQQTQHVRQIIKLPLHCLINAKKIIIPIMFKGCVHLECYEFTNILKIIENNNKLIPELRKTEIQCFYKDCENYITLNLDQLIAKNKIYFPQQLAEAINKDYSFALNVQWNYQMNKFVYDKKTINEQEQFSKIKKQLKGGNNHFLIFSTLSSVVNKEISDDLENKLRFSNYNITISEIKYPCRCMKCPMNKCFDLITFVAQASQLNMQEQKCQGCQASFSKANILDQIYYDKYLAQAIIERQENQNNSTLLISNQKQLALKLYLKKYQTLTIPQVFSLYFKNNKSNPYPKPFCSMSNERMTQPLILPLCLNKRAFEFDKFSQYLEKKQFSFSSFKNDYVCACQFCSNQQQFHLNMFYFDPVFQQFLSWFPEQWEKNVNAALIQQFKIDQTDIAKPKIIQKDPIKSAQTQFNYNNFFPENNQPQNHAYNNMNNSNNELLSRTYSCTNFNIQNQQYWDQNQQNQNYNAQASIHKPKFFFQTSPQQIQTERYRTEGSQNEFYLVDGELVPAKMYHARNQKP